MPPTDEYDLVDLIYEAALAPERFPRLLARLAREFDADTANCNVLDTGLANANLCFTHGIPPACLQSYAEHYAERDAWILGARRNGMAPGRVHLGPQLVADADLRRSEFHAGFLTELGVFHWCGARVAQWDDGETAISVQRSPRRAPFCADDVRRFQALVPHLRRAVKLLRGGAAAAERARLMEHLAAQDPFARIVVDRDARLAHANARGEALLEAGDALTLRDGRVAARHPSTDRRLAHLVAEVAVRGDAFLRDVGEVIAVPRWGHPRALLLRVLPLPAAQVPLAPPGRRHLLLHVSDPDDVRAPPEMLLRTWFGLTPAEARLARLLGDGTALRQAAESMGITHESARQYLKRVFRKTGCHRQAELVHLLCSARPMAPG